MRALQRNVGVERAIDVTSGPAGDRLRTRFAGGDFARLVLFGTGHGARLAWHLTFRATSVAYYDAVVDATDGAILYRQNLTKSDARADVFPNHPGADPAVDSNFANEGWLDAGATTLEGDFVHAYADVDDNDARRGDRPPRPRRPNDFDWPFTPFTSPPHPANGCTSTAAVLRGSRTRRPPSSWQANREQNAVQAFYLANTFHDHLASPNIGFDGLRGVDKVLRPDRRRRHDGPGQQPRQQREHVDAAGGREPDDADVPVRVQRRPMFRFRSINGGDSAAVLWHEYTHGLSNRLITNDEGTGALSSPHAGAMGEALERLVRARPPGPPTAWRSTPPHPARSTSAPTQTPCSARCGSSRSTAPSASAGAALPGRPSARGPGGYTFGDFGHVLGVPGGALGRRDLGADAVGPAQRPSAPTTAEQLITEGMRLSPPEPSFLDARNAILAAEAGIPGDDRDDVWEVFAGRGMGFFASAADCERRGAARGLRRAARAGRADGPDHGDGHLGRDAGCRCRTSRSASAASARTRSSRTTWPRPRPRRTAATR